MAMGNSVFAFNALQRYNVFYVVASVGCISEASYTNPIIMVFGALAKLMHPTLAMAMGNNLSRFCV
jgi:hypothetical protein